MNQQIAGSLAESNDYYAIRWSGQMIDLYACDLDKSYHDTLSEAMAQRDAILADREVAA